MVPRLRILLSTEEQLSTGGEELRSLIWLGLHPDKGPFEGRIRFLNESTELNRSTELSSPSAIL